MCVICHVYSPLKHREVKNAAAHVFRCSLGPGYTVQNAAGGIVRQDEGSRPGETGLAPQSLSGCDGETLESNLS